jgi:hypothetical protein
MSYLNSEIDELVVRIVRRALVNALGPDAFGPLRPPHHDSAAPPKEPRSRHVHEISYPSIPSISYGSVPSAGYYF